jgi:2-polyprenyl-6-methoxyphenol hydroxylase-like FAD-dependent oxidoreductase
VIDVLIVGAGPTGLAAACELAVRGIRCRIVDRLTARSDKSRANAVQARTLELLDKQDLAAPLIARGRPIANANFYGVRGREARLEFAALGLEETRYPYVLFVSQCDTEALLEARLRALGVAVEYGVALEGLADDGAGVTATLRRGDRLEQVRARYVVGADGAHSAVRALAGLPFVGGSYDQEFMLCDAELDWDLAPGETHIFWGREGVFACMPQVAGHQFRLVVTRARGAATAAEPTVAEMEAIARRMIRGRVRIVRSHWLTRFRLHHRVVASYRRGRAFLAGDAAHIHSPAGGQGMNTGMQDAFNLAWKLAFVAQRKAAPWLLDTYSPERRPVGRRLLATTDQVFHLGSSANAVVAEGRHWFAARIAALVLRSPARRVRAFRFLAQLGIRYRRSALSWRDPARGGSWRNGPRPGDRAPDVPLAGAGHLLERMRGPRWFLLRFHGGGPIAAAPIGAHRREHLEVIDVLRAGQVAPPGAATVLDADGAIRRAYGVDADGWYLLRPDGHVACRGADAAADRLTAYLDAHLAPDDRAPAAPHLPAAA